ncbi:two-component system sensor histidine kinase DesK [Luteibacter rhizovicinus]|uniref:Two-component system sensor histidine kinase DesK n=1 Tax=Luteibacter rhizovicinus TaxID=242606 RepID=A0A4R3YT33_9GAMM|nr:sensor histidine kinase [Luteibacter rhizovicinus]TCV94878.1 two-component system sensor histidine kinase DesK [Luteibacter rhizovicinus]
MMRIATPTPDSLLGSLGAPYLRWQAGVQVFWLIALIQAPLMARGFAWSWFGPTIATIPVFLYCYLRTFTGPVRQLPMHAIAIGLLGLVLWDINPVGLGYLLYGCMIPSYTGRLRIWLTAAGITFVVVGGLTLLLHTDQARMVVVVLGGFLGGLGNYVYVRSARRDLELRLSQSEVRRLATLAERERIGRDLHDLLGHTLSLITLKSELAKRLALADPERARQEMEEVERVARHTLGEVRAAVTGLRVGDLRSELVSARLMLEASGISLRVELPDSIDLPQATEAALSLVVREAVTNIHRHSRATDARVLVTFEGNTMSVRIVDNGCGGLAAHGNGVNGMRERVRAAGGALRIDSPPRKGTTLDITMPVADTAPRISRENAA